MTNSDWHQLNDWQKKHKKCVMTYSRQHGAIWAVRCPPLRAKARQKPCESLVCHMDGHPLTYTHSYAKVQEHRDDERSSVCWDGVCWLQTIYCAELQPHFLFTITWSWNFEPQQQHKRDLYVSLKAWGKMCPKMYRPSYIQGRTWI